MNGCCKPPEQDSGQKNKEIWGNFLLKMYFWASKFLRQVHRREIWTPIPPKNMAAKNIKILAQFLTILQLHCQYLQQDIVKQKTNFDHSHTCALDLVNFGPQMVKNRIGIPTQPTGGGGQDRCQ